MPKLLCLALAVVGTSASSQAIVRTESSSAVHNYNTYFAATDAPKCFVDASGRVVVHYSPALHTGSFKCSKSADDSTCTCTWNHPTHHFGGCMQVEENSRLHHISGDCSGTGKDSNIFELNAQNKLCNLEYTNSLLCTGEACTQEKCLQTAARNPVAVTSVIYDANNQDNGCRYSTTCTAARAQGNGGTTWTSFFLKGGAAGAPMVHPYDNNLCSGEYNSNAGEGYYSTTCTDASCTEEQCVAEGAADSSVTAVVWNRDATTVNRCRFSYTCTEGRATDGCVECNWKSYFRQFRPDRRDTTTPIVKHTGNKYCTGEYNSGAGQGYYSTTCTGASCTEEQCVAEGAADSSVMSVVWHKDAAQASRCRFSHTCTAARALHGSLTSDWQSYFRENGPFVEDLEKKYCNGEYSGTAGYQSTACVGASCTLEKCLEEGEQMSRGLMGTPTSVVFSPTQHAGPPCRFSFTCTKATATGGGANSLWVSYHRASA